MTKTSRRRFFTVSALGAAAAALAPRPLVAAAAPTAAEQANIKVVNDFCGAWASHDLNKLMSFFADNCAYRVSETRDPIKGREAVTATIKGFLDRVVRFEVLDTYAKGPMVFNERIDHFTPGGQMPLKSWRGVGVFFLKDGKIVEWQDYTISTERA
jgi:limonene-1,2-epoxide hydrolase